MVHPTHPYLAHGLFEWTRDMFLDINTDLAQSGCIIYHPDRNFKEILNLAMKLKNSINNTHYGYICSTATLKENMTPKSDLYCSDHNPEENLS